MGRLEGKIAIVTGASRGIGRGVAMAYAREGATLALVGIRDEQALHSVRDDIRSLLGGDAWATLCDVGDRQQMGRFIQEVAERWGRIDILVNNAGVLKLARTPRRRVGLSPLPLTSPTSSSRLTFRPTASPRSRIPA